MKESRDLTQGNIKKHLVRLTGPMIFGILGLTIFNLVDTYFVGLLGTNELAALSFTFPIVLTFSSLTLGVSTGVTAVVSKAAGKSNQGELKALIFDSMLLSLICVILFVGMGFLILKPALNLMQAEEEIIPIIMEYMVIWLPGLVFVVFPMVGNGIIRALGDTKTPGIVMIIAGTVNAVLDPLFIFGIGPFPELGVAGAAIATLIGRFITFSVALYVLMKRDHVLVLQKRKFKEMAGTWKEILTVALPDGLSRIILPVGSGIITGLIAVYGVASVAGFGIAVKIEGFIIIVAGSMASVIIPFAGQNIGAGKFDRVKKLVSYSNRFILLLQGSLFIVLLIFAPFLAGLFSKDTEVVRVAALYLRIVSVAYGAKGIILLSSALLNVMRRPLIAVAVNLGQMFIVFIPLSLLGNMMFGITGIFIALALSLVAAGIVAWKLAENRLNKRMILAD
ncbi:MAG: MATE family efflux transporter [Clostridiales bacterium]|nr:MATE family efflux transporter [Clostridiales bacterium]